MSLHGETVLLTRPKEQAEETAKLIRQRGGVPIIAPLIAIAPPEQWDELDKCLQQIENYDAIIFTSANAVRFTLQRASNLLNGMERLRKIPAIPVGEKTAAALEEFGLRAAFIPSEFAAEALVQEILLRYKQGNFLFPRGNLRKDTVPHSLRGAGLGVDEPVVYRTVQASTEEVRKVRYLLQHGKINVITFASPSAVENFAKLIGVEILSEPSEGRIIIATIGKVTARCAIELGFNVDIVSQEATFESLLESVEHELDKRRAAGHTAT
ncbi:MAG: uroporphyrinogen-III synthase [Bacteroidota bacterium]